MLPKIRLIKSIWKNRDIFYAFEAVNWLTVSILAAVI
jgi:hypothetical protein